MPKRINRAIELLEQGQPIYYTGGHTGADLSYEAGKAMANTWADYINIGMEHGAFDMAGLDRFMRGLVDGGPTNSGHRTPAVIVEVPVDGGSEDIVRYNAWQFRQNTGARRSRHPALQRRNARRSARFRGIVPLHIPKHRRGRSHRQGNARRWRASLCIRYMGHIPGRIPR